MTLRVGDMRWARLVHRDTGESIGWTRGKVFHLGATVTLICDGGIMEAYADELLTDEDMVPILLAE